MNASQNKSVYDAWYAMHNRCYNTDYKAYNRYGGRGIVVCLHWHTYSNFKNDMGTTWFPHASVDRINNDGNYEAGNCRWLPKELNNRPLKYPIFEMLELYNKGLTQSVIATMYGTNRPHVSLLLKRARHE